MSRPGSEVLSAAELSQVLLATAEALAAATSVGEVAREVSAALVPRLCDACEIVLPGGDGGSVRVVAGPPGVVERERAALPAADHPVHTVLATEAAIEIDLDDPATAHLLGPASDPMSARSLGVQRAIMVPMTARRGVVGVLSAALLDGGEWPEGVREIVRSVGRFAGLAVGNLLALGERERSADRMALAARLAVEAASISEPSVLSDRLLAAVAADLGARAGAVYVAAGDHVELVASVGYRADQLEGYETIPLEAPSPATDVCRSGGPLVVRTTADIIERYPVLRTIPTFADQALLAMPLRSAEGIAGAATWVFADEHPIDEADLAFVELLTEQAAVAIARMRALAERAVAAQALGEREAELSEYRARLEALADADVIGVISGEGDRITVANRAFLRLVGLERLPPDGLAFTDITPPEWAASDEAVIRQMLEVGHAEPFEKEYLTAEGARVAVLIGGTTLSADPFTWIVYVADISDRKRAEAAVLEANQALADLLARQRHIAESLQRHLLPEQVPELPGTELSAHYWPSADDLEVSGDLYDAFPLSGSRWGLLVGDVCGKGAEAAAVIGAARHTARAAALHVDDPSDVLRWVHEAVHAAHRTFVTMAFATYDDRDGRFQLSLGGHPRALLVRATGEVEHVGSFGTLLGLLPPELRTSDHQLGAGDLLVLFTDGITDAPPTEAMGEAELGAWFAERRGEPLGPLGEQLRVELERRRPDGPGDDVALLLARRR